MGRMSPGHTLMLERVLLRMLRALPPPLTSAEAPASMHLHDGMAKWDWESAAGSAVAPAPAAAAAVWPSTLGLAQFLQEQGGQEHGTAHGGVNDMQKGIGKRGWVEADGAGGDDVERPFNVGLEARAPLFGLPRVIEGDGIQGVARNIWVQEGSSSSGCSSRDSSVASSRGSNGRDGAALQSTDAVNANDQGHVGVVGREGGPTSTAEVLLRTLRERCNSLLRVHGVACGVHTHAAGHMGGSSGAGFAGCAGRSVRDLDPSNAAVVSTGSAVGSSSSSSSSSHKDWVAESGGRVSGRGGNAAKEGGVSATGTASCAKVDNPEPGVEKSREQASSDGAGGEGGVGKGEAGKGGARDEGWQNQQGGGGSGGSAGGSDSSSSSSKGHGSESEGRYSQGAGGRGWGSTDKQEVGAWIAAAGARIAAAEAGITWFEQVGREGKAKVRGAEGGQTEQCGVGCSAVVQAEEDLEGTATCSTSNGAETLSNSGSSGQMVGSVDSVGPANDKSSASNASSSTSSYTFLAEGKLHHSGILHTLWPSTHSSGTTSTAATAAAAAASTVAQQHSALSS
eukprot:scaffold111137_cov18-Tisochrysis_lutea.AAC.4